jgi:hypothetical protein
MFMIHRITPQDAEKACCENPGQMASRGLDG